MAPKNKNAASVETSPASPSVEDVLEAAQAGEPMNTDGRATATDSLSLVRSLRAAGATVEFAGGSLPPLEFARPGTAYFVRYQGAKEVPSDEGKTFKVLGFDVLDASKFDAVKKTAPTIGVGSILESATLVDAMNKTKPGDLLAITFHGMGKAAKGKQAPKLFAVEKIA